MAEYEQKRLPLPVTYKWRQPDLFVITNSQ